MTDEYDLSLILTEELMKLYSIDNSFGSGNVLYNYLYIRCSIINDKKKLDKIDLIKFILEELNIDVYSKESKLPYIIYNDVEYDYMTQGNELIENLEFRADFEGNLKYESIIDEIYKKGYLMSTKYIRFAQYKTYIKYNRLKALNEYFNITPSYSKGVEGFQTSESHNPYKRSLEEALEAALNIDKHKSFNTTYITEDKLENYLYKNLDLIEEGLQFIERQVVVEDGRIDILAKDKNDCICIIELKIKEDKSIVWQVMYYPEEIKKKYKTKNVRMITVTPEYSNHLKQTLNNIENVEMFEYDIVVSNGEITSLKINKAQ